MLSGADMLSVACDHCEEQEMKHVGSGGYSLKGITKIAAEAAGDAYLATAEELHARGYRNHAREAYVKAYQHFVKAALYMHSGKVRKAHDGADDTFPVNGNGYWG
jgi:hypothetical protein